jgi:hypothetical protein
MVIAAPSSHHFSLPVMASVGLDNDMFTVLMILGTIFALFTVLIATILGLLGFWGALIGIVIGLLIQFGNK